MATPEAERISHLAEVMRRAESQQDAAIAKLASAVAQAVTDTQDDPIELGALVRALIKTAANVAYSTVGLQCDLQFRTEEDFAGIAGAIWQDELAQGEMAIEHMKATLGKVDQTLAERCRLAPSDPSKRPGLAPANKLPARSGPPSSIEDFIGEAGATGADGEEDDEDLFAKIAASRGAGGMAN